MSAGLRPCDGVLDDPADLAAFGDSLAALVADQQRCERIGRAARERVRREFLGDTGHLGHAFTYVSFDVLHRYLEYLGHDVVYVQNLTDVDDDMLRKAREVGVYYLDLAAEEMAKFDAAMTALDVLPSFSEPRATSAIERIACWQTEWEIGISVVESHGCDGPTLLACRDLAKRYG